MKWFTEDDYTDIGPVRIKAITDKAVLLILEPFEKPMYRQEVWIPLSLCETEDSAVQVGCELDEFNIRTWFAEKESLA